MERDLARKKKETKGEISSAKQTRGLVHPIKYLKHDVGRPLISMRRIKWRTRAALALVNRREFSSSSSDSSEVDSRAGHGNPATLSRDRAWNQSSEGAKGRVEI